MNELTLTCYRFHSNNSFTTPHINIVMFYLWICLFGSYEGSRRFQERQYNDVGFALIKTWPSVAGLTQLVIGTKHGM